MATDINSVPIASTLADSDYLHITAGGTHGRALASLLADKARAQALTHAQAALLDRVTEGAYIMYHRKSDGYPCAAKASKWTALQSAGEIADGVLVSQGGVDLVVAPTGSPTTMHWASSETLVAPSGDYSTNLIWAMSHFDGKNRTSAILADATIGGDGSGYAPGYCASYSRGGLGAGKWWLPSLGELMMIFGNMEKINACLNLIDGAQLLPNSCWASSEASSRHAWLIILTNGFCVSNPKTQGNYFVRPVSTFIN